MMKLGIVIYSNEPETVWNAFRLGTFSCKQGDIVSVFLLGMGVEAESWCCEKFDVIGQMRSFTEAGGSILACGTCLKIRQSEGSDICPLSTMHDLHVMIRDSDKLLSF
jgi:sulfur relay (sulfurtransferase) complex TusBCD TusD component (DsrE family)